MRGPGTRQCARCIQTGSTTWPTLRCCQLICGLAAQLMGVDKLRLGRQQPFFHCLVDERDRAGGVSTYVAQVQSHI